MPPATELMFQGRDVALAADSYGDADAPPALLAHGGGQTRHSWGGTAALLANRGYRAITVDLRGHGDSEWAPDGDYSLDAFAADLRAVIDQIGTPPALIGASLGGLSSLVAIARADDPAAMASALVLVDVAVHLEPAGTARIGDFMRANPDGFATLDEVADAVASYNPHRPRPTDLSGLRKNVRLGDDGRWRWHWDPRFMGNPDIDEPRTFLVREQLEADARSLKLPTLLVRGGQSDLLSEAGARSFLALAPHSEFVDVPGAGHMVAGDRNDTFNAGIVDFLGRHLPVAR
jgi:pimeloyl-ACP methyl ester carboxylesterase